MNSLQMIFKYWYKSPKEFILGTSFQVISSILATIAPIFLGKIIGLFDPNKTNVIRAWDLWGNFLVILLVGVLAYFFGRAGRIKGAVVSAGALYYLRMDIHDALYSQSFSYFDKHETGQLIARATSDIDQTEMIFGMGFAIGLQSVFQIIMVLISGFAVAPQLAWIIAVVFPTSIICSLAIAFKMKPIFIDSRENFGEITNTIRENLVGSQVVRMFGTQDKEKAKFAKNNEAFYRISIQSVKYSSMFMPLILLFMALMIITMLYFGGNLIIRSLLDLQQLITFQSYIGLSIFPMVILGQILTMYIQADAALTRVRDVLESTPDVKNSPNALKIDRAKGEIEFEKVSFGYTAMTRVLNKISFKIAPGKTLAILGTTGSGKSTIISLLPRFYDVSEGSIKLDGIDIRKYLIEDLRKQMAIVSQDTFLFNKSIAENIKFGNEKASLEEVIQAAKIADLHDFIMNLPNKYDTIVGERGTRLSGGQKQRLSIARALLIKPRILIMDDSTSSVDVETEFKIQQALAQLMKGITNIIITQRLSTIRNADIIMILDKGRIIGLGTHDELIKNNVLYQQIYETLFHKQKSEIKNVN
jgi:ATP-binding cassette subfamily B multidrug efflux pump